MITLSDNAVRMIAPVIGVGEESFISLGAYKVGDGDSQVFAEEAVNAFKDNPFVLFEMAHDPDSAWSYAVEKMSLDLLISRCKTLDSLVLLYYALPPNDAYVSGDAVDGHPNDHHAMIVVKMVEVCKDNPRKLWILFNALKHVEDYRDLVVEQINKLAPSKSKSEEKSV